MTYKVKDVYDPAATADFIHIVRVDLLSTPIIKVLFDDGAERTIDFSPVIARSKWFRTLDVPTTFETVEVINNGRALQWETGADYCADALRILGDEQLAAKGMSA